MLWRFLTLSADGRQVTVRYISGDKSCVLPSEFAVVTLAAPLGGRVLLHPVVSPDWRGLPL